MSRSENVVSLLTRYPSRDRFDPGEDRMTAAVAAALARATGLAADLTASFCPDADLAARRPHSARIETQRPVVPRSGEPPYRVDMEITLDLDDGDTARAWVEAKLRSSPGANQLQKYASELRAEPGGKKLLVLLAPESRRAELRGEIEKVGGRFASWSDVHRVFRAWTEGHPRDPWNSFVKEVMDYMEAQGHRSVGRVRKSDLEVLGKYPEAASALDQLCNSAISELADHGWQTVPSSRTGAWASEYEQAFKPKKVVSGRGRKSHKEYDRFVLSTEIDAGKFRISAGAYFKRPCSHGIRTRVLDLGRRSPEEVWTTWDGPDLWLGRFWAPSDAELRADHDAQIRALADFARRVFEDLHANPLS